MSDADTTDLEVADLEVAESSSDGTLREMITTYIALRDKKAAVVKAQAEVLKQYNEAMAEIGLFLKGWLAQQKVNAISCEAGVAFIRRKRSATVADAGIFREHVISNKNFELANFTANVEAVEGYATEHDGQLPPGVNFRIFEDVSVNRK